MKRKIMSLIFVLTASLLFALSAHADVLGTQSGGWSSYMGADTYFHNVQFTSDSVGLQNEYYVEYTPNNEAVPVVINGWSIWGTRNITQAEQYMTDNGLRPLVGINADYFSFKTGIPMGYTIADGEILSKEYGGQDAVGFRSDGTGFIKWLDVKTTLSDENGSIEIMYINKWCQPGFAPVYLLTDKFGTSTKTSSECIFVICTPKEGRLHIGESMTVTVDDVFLYDGAIEIPEGKMVFVMDKNGQSDLYEFLSKCYAGKEMTITNEALGDDGTWATAENAVSTVGGRLVTNGVANSDFEAGAAPRTAVGIKENGNIIFYTLDGRQTGHSYGAQLKTLAKRMVELGCVEAINLDGGGSTTISAVFPGSSNSMIMNSPSEGSLRNVANFIFLKDNREKSDIPWIVNFKSDAATGYLSGMTGQVEIDSVYDTGNYKMDGVYGISYRTETGTQSTIDENGYMYLSGTGDVNVVLSSVNGDIAAKTYSVYETPEEIKLYNRADWHEVDSITTNPNEELQLNLSAISYVGGNEILSDNSLYTWEVTGNVGTITPDGIFTLADTAGESGSIWVTAGGKTKEIPVIINDYPKAESVFADVTGHWAQDIIDEMASSGIINGMEENGVMVFKPDNNMTRAEFASMIAKYLLLDTDSYADVQLNFTDTKDIPQWAENAVKAVYSEGIILGRVGDNGETSFAPYDNITRAEAMTILGRILPDEDELPNLPFADSESVPQWAQDGIQKLYSIGIVNGYEDNTILPNNNIKRSEAATMLYKTDSISK